MVSGKLEKTCATPITKDAKMNEDLMGEKGAGAAGQEKNLCVIPESPAGHGNGGGVFADIQSAVEFNGKQSTATVPHL